MKHALFVTLLIITCLVSCSKAPTATLVPSVTTLPENTPTQTSTPIPPRPALTTEPIWSEGFYFPRFPQPQGIYVIRVETGLENWWDNPNRSTWRANHSVDVMAALTLVSMQGIINRSDPAVYLDWQDAGRLNNAAHFWLTPLANYVDVVQLDVEGSNAVEFLWQIFSPRFKGAVIYDPEVSDTINLATMLAGLEDRLMLAPDQLNLPIIQSILAALEANCSPDSNPLHLPTLPDYQCATDLRLLADQEGWNETSSGLDSIRQNRYHLYLWVYDNLWARLEKRAIGMISPGAPSSRWVLGNQSVFDPLGLAWRDYLIALRLPALWLSTVDEPESTLLEQFLNEAPSPIPLMSFYDGTEHESVNLASRHGDWIPVISNSNTPISTGNLTVLSAIDLPAKRFQPRLDGDQLFAALGNQPLVALYSTDGDALQYILDRGFYGIFSWEDVTDNIFGFSINPTLANLSPLAWNYYVETAGRTAFISGISGAGYVDPSLMSDSQITAYLDYTANTMDLTGIRTLYVLESSGLFDERLATFYYQRLKGAGYLGAIGGNGPHGDVSYEYPGVPAPVVRNTYIMNNENASEILSDLLDVEPGTILLDFPPNYHQGQTISDPTARDGIAIRFNRPDLPNCCMVIASGRMDLAPGIYTITYRLKVTENQSNQPFAHFFILQDNGVGPNLVDRTLRPSDFTIAGEWQDFSETFTLDKFVVNIRLWLDYMGGTSDNASANLYGDTISLTRTGGLGLPVVHPIIMGLVGPTGPLDDDLRFFTEEFERRGGVLLTPDELMAALNPEYMLGWAAPMLGSDDPALAEAQHLLDNGQFLQALYIIREALRAFPEHTYTTSDGYVTVQANAWVTDLQLDSQVGDLVFHTHASPLAEIHIRLGASMDLFSEALKVTVDNLSIAAKISSDGTAWLVEFVLAGGPHEIHVVKR
jgi:hypothetical protein